MSLKVKELKTAYLRVSVRKTRPFFLIVVREWLYELDLMKILACFLSLCLVSVAFAQDDPTELVKLRKTWENSVSGVQTRADTLYREGMNKTNKLYHEELKQMKDNFMAAKNLQGAIAVDAEIKKLVAEHGKQKFTPSKKTEVKPAVRDELSRLDGVWVESWGKYKVIRTIKDQKMVNVWKNINRISTLSIEDDIITIQQEDGYWWKLKVDVNNPDTFECIRKDGMKSKFERFNW